MGLYWRRLGMATLAACALPTAARAEQPQLDGQTIIVTGRIEGYRAIDIASATKTETPILDVPQSISVITGQQLRDQAIRSVSDLARLVPGLSAGQGEGHRDQIILRGNASTADFFVDGLRDDVQYYRGFYNIDRVEVLRGSNAMIFGRGGGGGVINRVTKSAIVDRTAFGLSGSADSFGAWYLAGDANLGFGSGGARLNAFYEELANHRDAYDGHRLGINPTVGAEIGAVKLQLGYEYVKDARVVDRGVPSGMIGTIDAPAAPLRGYRDAFFGSRDANRARFEGHMVRFRGETALTDRLTWSTQALYGDYDKIYSNAYAATPPDAQRRVGIEAYRDITRRRNVIAQTNLEWHVGTGGIAHVLLFGAEYTDQDTHSERVNGFYPTSANPLSRRYTVSLDALDTIPAPTFIAGNVAGAGNRRIVGRLSQYSVYAQDQISLGRHVDVIAGIRYDRLRNDVDSLFVDQATRRTDTLWSPRVGIVLKPVEPASIYASWSRSYLPQSGDQFVSFDPGYAALKPEAFDNYEIGAKWAITPALTLTGAIYRLDRGNTRAAGPTPGSLVLTGSQRTEGAEIALVGRPLPGLQLSASYSFTDAEIRRTTSAAPAGRKVAQTPRHHASLWSRYDVNDRLGIGAGVFHQSSQFASIGNAVRLPGYTRVDAALFYKVADGIEAQVNVENLTNTRYVPLANSDNNITTGAPLNARVTLGARF
jgi:catecholate siderophore receptor